MNRMYRPLVRRIALAAFALGMAVHINAAEAPSPGAATKTEIGRAHV